MLLLGWVYAMDGAQLQFMKKKPKKAVTLTGWDGKTQITFWPDDIKALITSWWAEARYDTDFMGNSCTSTSVAKDPRTGIFIGSSCASNNAASWHIVFGNHIGIQKKQIIFDPEPDGEVWNQPAYKHSFKYFNVLTNNYYSNPLSARVNFSSVSSSRNAFLNFVYRYANKSATKYVVGVVASVTYIAEDLPVQTTAIRQETTKVVTYKYELELDGSNRIIGGQWYTNFHPNFVWKVHNPDAASGPYDKQAPSFNGSVQSLKNLSSVAKKQSQYNMPLKAVVKYLVANSS
jgi:hypothetical protein